MKKMRCQFDISKDWVKPSLIFAYGIAEKENLADVLVEVYQKSLTDEFGDNLEGLGPDIDDKINAINEIKDLISNLCSIYDDAKYIQSKNPLLLHEMQLKYIKILNGYQNELDSFFNSVLNQFQKSYLPDTVEQEQIDDSFTNKELQSLNNDMESNIEIESELDRTDDNTVEASIMGTSSSRSIVIANDIDFESTIGSDADVSHKLFKGKNAAKEDFVKRFTTEIIGRAVISVDPNNPKIYTNNLEIDRAVKEYKDKLFFDVFGEPLYVGDGEMKSTRSDLKQKINDKINEYNSLNDGKGLLIKDIDAMLLSSDKTKYDEFINFSIFKNFDSLIKIYGNRLVNIKDNSDYMPDILGDNSAKYYFKKDANAVSAFSNSEFVDAMSKVSGVAKMFIESTPEIDENGLEIRNKYLRVDRVFNTTTKLGKIISRVNHFESLKAMFEDVIKKDQGIKGYNKDLDDVNIAKDEVAMIRSLYVKFFKTNDSLINGKLGKFGTNVLKNYKNLSFQEVLKEEYNRGNMPINLVDIIGSTFAKTISLKYDEVSFSPELREARIKNLEDNVSRRQAALLNQSLSASFFTANSGTSDRLMSRYNIEVDIETYKVKIQLPSGMVITHDVLSGKSVNSNGEDFDFASLSVPSIVGLDNWTNPDIHSDYMFILSAFQNFTTQQLKGLDSSIINTFKSNIDNNTGSNKHIDYLMSILSNAAFIHKFIVDRIPGGIVDNDAKINEALNTIPEIKPDDIYDKRSRLFKTQFNRFATASIGVLSNAMSIVTGDKSKSVIKNSDGNSLPVYGPVNLINDVKSLIDLIQINRTKFQSKIPLEDNLFIQSPNLLKGLSVRTNYESNGKAKSSAKLSEAETLTVDIMHAYGDNKVTTGNPSFQPTVFSDKTKHSGVEVNGNAEVTFFDEVKQEQLTKTYSSMNADEFKMLHYQSQHSYYSNLEKSMLQTYNEVFVGHDAVASYLELTNVLKHANIIDYDGTTLSVKKHLKKFDGKTIKQEIETLNKIFKAQQSYIKTGKFKNINDAAAFVNSVTDKSFNKMAKLNTRRPIIVELLITKGNGTAIINPLLIERMNMYRSDFSTESESYLKMMNAAKQIFSEKLKRGFFVDAVSDNGVENGLVNEIYDKFKINKNDWINSYTKRVVPFKENGGVITLNPFIEQYFWEHNVISENFQNLTVGTIFGHKGAGKLNSDIEAKKTIAMLKRMVAHQATFHPYYNGSLNGVNHITKTVYVKDPQAYLQNVMGLKKDDQEITDGGSAISMVESILKNNSLLDQAVAIHKKDIGMTIDPYYNAAGLMKHASHALSNEDIRRTKDSSFDLKLLVNKMYRGEPCKVADGKIYQWNIDGIPINLDITRDFNNRFIGDISSLNPMFKDGYYYKNNEGDIIKITRISPMSSIENEGSTIISDPNVYSLSQQNISKGIDASIENVPINNLSDLWNVFGAENSISIDENGRFGADGMKFSYSDASHYLLAEFTNRVGFWRNEDGMKGLLQQTMNKHSEVGLTVLSNTELRKLTDKLTTVDDRRNFNKEIDLPNQASIYQPLKLNHIGMINFTSGQKVGAKNVDSDGILTNEEDFWVSETNNLHTGVQLDYEHETDDSHVTEMTQVISAMIFNGDTRDLALNTYSAIGDYVKNQLQDFIESANNPSLDGQRKSWMQLADVVVKKQGSDKGSLQGMILSAVDQGLAKDRELIAKVRAARESSNPDLIKMTTADLAEYMKSSFNMPMSDSSLFNTAFSTLANHFTAAAIRRKFEGGGLIISGLSGFIELQDVPNIDLTAEGLVVSSYKSITPESYFSWEQELKLSNYYKTKIAEGLSHTDIVMSILKQKTNASEVSIGDTVVYSVKGIEKRVQLDRFSDFLTFKEETMPDTEVVIDRSVKRQMRPLTWTWNSAGNKFNLYDQPQIRRAYLFDDYLNLLNKTLNSNPENLKPLELESLSKFELDLLKAKYTKATTDLITFNKKYGNSLIGLGFDDTIIEEFKDLPKLHKIANVKYIRQVLKTEIRDECKTIDEGNMSVNNDIAYMLLKNKKKFIEFYPDQADLVKDISAFKSVDEVILYCLNNGIKVPVNNLVAAPMEIGMPNMNASKYGLSKDIDVSEVTQAVFENQELSRIKSKIKHYDMFLRDINGKHLYVFVNDSKNHKNLINSDSFKESKTETIEKDGKTFLIDPATGNTMYEIGNNRFGHISQNGEIHEAVIVNSIDDLNLLVYNTTKELKKYANLMINYAVKDRKLLNMAIEYKLKYDSNEVEKGMLGIAQQTLNNKQLNEKVATENIINVLENINKSQFEGLRNQAKKNAKYRYASFQESLNHTVARINW